MKPYIFLALLLSIYGILLSLYMPPKFRLSDRKKSKKSCGGMNGRYAKKIKKQQQNTKYYTNNSPQINKKRFSKRKNKNIQQELDHYKDIADVQQEQITRSNDRSNHFELEANNNMNMDSNDNVIESSDSDII